MALIEKLLNYSSTPPAAKAESWLTMSTWFAGYENSVAGVAMDADTALKISTVYACVGLISETLASLPTVTYRYIENELGRERARNNPLYEILHDQPNDNQTAFEFKQMMQAHALLRGSGIAEIKPGERGFVNQLVPLHPDFVQKERLASGRVRYRVTDDIGRDRTLNKEDVFEVGGLSLDGWTTLSVIGYARDSLGLTLAAERFGGRFFKNDSRPGGILRTDGRLSKDAAKRLKDSWEAAHRGQNQNRVAVLEEGLQWQQVGLAPEDAQFLQTREFQAEDVCRWFRVPPHMVGLTSKATSWGSGIEQMSIGFVTYTLRPWLSRWIQAIRRDLILAPQTYFVDFLVEDLLRGDITSRYNAYSIGRQWGWLSVNEIRRYENLNPVPGGETYLQPMNMEPAGEQPAPPAGRAGHHRLLAEESAGRVVRKEIAAMTRAGQRCENKAEFHEAVHAFYDEHASFVAQALRMDIGLAKSYTEYNRRLLLEHGIEAITDWQTDRVQVLVNLAIGDNYGND